MRLIKRERLAESYNRWDLEVEDNHNFVVSGVVVHNSNCRVGLVNGKPVAGSMELRRKRPVVEARFEWTDDMEVVGARVKKTSPKPFKSGNKVNTVKAVLPHPELAGIKAFSFEEDDSVVECRRCLPEDFEVKEASLDSEEVKRSTYWFPLSNANVFAMLNDMCPAVDPQDPHNLHVVLYGEVYGGSVQELDYGIAAGKGLGFRAFGLKVNGRFLDWDDFYALCGRYGVETVPVLWRGPFSMVKAKELADGVSTMAGHMREGTVVYPVKERENPKVGRVILKFIGVEYELSKHKNKDTKDV